MEKDILVLIVALIFSIWLEVCVTQPWLKEREEKRLQQWKKGRI